MKTQKPRSLMREIIAKLLFFHIGILFLFGIAFVAFLLRADMGGILVDPEVTEIAARAIARGPDGRLALHDTEELVALKKSAPGLWFVARSDQGEIIRYGQTPEALSHLSKNLESVSFADIRDVKAPYPLSAVIRRTEGPAGSFTVLGQGRLFSLTFVVLFLSNLLMIPILILLGLITLIATPWIVKRAFSGVSKVAEEAGDIDIERRGDRLSEDRIPMEILPLVQAINGALQRLDEGYERNQRFIADAAHELRTPIAILQARVDGMNASAEANRLARDVGRLATLAEQLLDLQRLDRNLAITSDVDLRAIARDVAADIAPLLIANGCKIEVAERGRAIVKGDATAIERAIANLVRNAVEHGGSHILIRVDGGTLEIEDNGPGIPVSERSRIFEPFHRVRARSTGAGLGLNLVRQVMDHHGGHVEVSDAEGGGTIMRLMFPRHGAQRRSRTQA